LDLAPDEERSAIRRGWLLGEPGEEGETKWGQKRGGIALFPYSCS